MAWCLLWAAVSKRSLLALAAVVGVCVRVIPPTNSLRSPNRTRQRRRHPSSASEAVLGQQRYARRLPRRTLARVADLQRRCRRGRSWRLVRRRVRDRRRHASRDARTRDALLATTPARRTWSCTHTPTQPAASTPLDPAAERGRRCSEGSCWQRTDSCVWLATHHQRRHAFA